MCRLIALTFMLMVASVNILAGTVNSEDIRQSQNMPLVVDAIEADDSLTPLKLKRVSENEHLVEEALTKDIKKLEDQIKTINDNNSNVETDELKLLVKSQQDQIDNLLNEHILLQKTLKNIKEGGHSNWISILLACVAILVTVLGVVIALISFIGYRNFKEATTEAAEKIANDVASKVSGEVANAKIPEIAKQELTRLIDEGELKEHLESAVDIIVRRDRVAPEISGFSKYPEIDEEGYQ